MTKIPKNFPEYLIMHKTLTRKIKHLENEKEQSKEEDMISEIQKKINSIKNEIKKIEAMFPENFFENKT